MFVKDKEKGQWWFVKERKGKIREEHLGVKE